MLLFYITPERLKLTHNSLISICFKYYFKISTLCLLFLSSRLFVALEFGSHYFGVLLWKIVKSLDHNETKPTIGKIFRKCRPVRQFSVMPRKYLSCFFVNKGSDNCNKVFYLQKNKKYYSLETEKESELSTVS